MLKKIYSVLKKIFTPLPLIIIMSFVLALLIYFLGSRIGASGIYPFRDEALRFWTAIFFAGLGSLLLLFVLIRALFTWLGGRGKREKREPTIEEQEAAAMNKVFDRAVAVIRKRWSGGGRRIYGLPWYLVLGKQEAGKTSIIENGDLRFPIDHEIKAEVDSIGSFAACRFINWRVSGNEAVLLDMAGEVFLPHEERSSVDKVLWGRFLRNLQRVRPRRPINGVILTIDLPEFAGYSQFERERYSALVRRTIDDLVEQLGTRLTIHVMFTKMDQIAGFADYFENLSASEREMLFGFHFLYEGKHTLGWLEQFEKQYTAFLERMNKHIKKRVLGLKNARSRREAFAFYRGFLGLEAPLIAFLNSALTPDKFSTPPLVRGIYFASNTQENPPRNVFLEAISHRYQLPEPLYGASQNAKFPYFITPFFKRAVFPEAGLAGNNLKVERRYRRRLLFAFLIGAAACLLGGFYWNYSYENNLHQAQIVLDKTLAFSQLNRNAQMDHTGYTLLEPLNTIRGATFEFGNYRRVSPVVGQLTLYQGGKIGPIADKTYKAVLSQELASFLTKGVEETLRRTCPKGTDRELELLRVYRMLGDSEGRDDRVIQKYFKDLWQRNFEAQAEVQNQLTGHLDYMLTTVPESYELDENLVITAQNNLGRLTPYRRVYASLRSDAERQLPNALEFSTSVGATFGLVYRANNLNNAQGQRVAGEIVHKEREEDNDMCGHLSEKTFERAPFEVPRFFTNEEYKDFFIPQNQKIAQVAAKDLWVLGKLETTNYSQADYDRIQSKVREIYTDEYIRVWRQSLNTMEVKPFEDIRDATEILRALSGTENPIRRVAQLVSENTLIYEPDGEILKGDEAADSKLPIDPDREAGLLIYDSFGDIRRMLEDKPEGGQASIYQIEEALIAVYDYLKIIRDAPSPNAKALEVAIKRAELVGEDPIYVLQRIAERVPSPFDQHLSFIASETWRIVMLGATQELNRQWHDDIYGDYQRLIAGKYPFNRESDIDLPVEDFKEFFQPGGILETFYKNELLIFVDEKTGEPRVIDGQSLEVDKSFAGSLRKAIDITRSFFNADGELMLSFKVERDSMSANLSRAVLNFEGQVVVNNHGPSRPVTIVWPNLIDLPSTSRVDMSPLHGTGRSYGKQFYGSWSWLRLYDSAQKTNFQNNAVNISFTNNNNQSATFTVIPDAKVNPFFNSPLSAFELPSRLRTRRN